MVKPLEKCPNTRCQPIGEEAESPSGIGENREIFIPFL
jgi:hypothetical protein